MAKLAEQAERYDEVSPVESHGARPGARSRHSRRTSSAVVGCPWQRSGFEQRSWAGRAPVAVTVVAVAAGRGPAWASIATNRLRLCHHRALPGWRRTRGLWPRGPTAAHLRRC